MTGSGVVGTHTSPMPMMEVLNWRDDSASAQYGVNDGSPGRYPDGNTRAAAASENAGDLGRRADVPAFSDTI